MTKEKSPLFRSRTARKPESKGAAGRQVRIEKTGEEGMRKMELLNQISTLMQQGRAPKVKELVAQALQEGVAPQQILQIGLLDGMGIIGEKFKNNQVFVPEVLIAARTMNAALDILRPHLAEAGVEDRGTVVIGTVKGDMHDIGKNLVKMMMEGKGLKVVDLGVNVSAAQFTDAAIEHNAQVIACSALLTTTMNEMKSVVELVQQRAIPAKVMVGGAPVTQTFCDAIGADCYTADAASAADAALGFCS